MPPFGGSMELRRFAGVGDFLDAAGGFLVAREAEHNLIFGIASSLRETPEAYSGPPYLAVVVDDDRVVAAAIQTPPFRVVLSEVDDPKAIDLLADDLLERDLPGAAGPVDVVRAFVDARMARGGPPASLEMSDRAYRLTAVRPLRPVAGRSRLATAGDRELLLAWVEAFKQEALGEADPADVVADVDHWIARRGRTIHLWEDGEAVSLCGVGGPTPNGIRIGPVYTPPGLRGRGYATALVAAVSQAELDAGRTFVFLFTDLANRTSNHIYQVIGYEPVRDFDDWTFERG
jgi:hypothetical protein